MVSELEMSGTFLYLYVFFLANWDLPLPHGLAPSETMVWDHGLNPPLSTVNPMQSGVFCVWSALFWIWSRRPRAQGVGVDPFLLIFRSWNSVKTLIGGSLVGVWNGPGGKELQFFGLWIFNFQSLKFEKIALSADFQGFSWKFRPLKNIFRTLENGHSIRHQSIPPLSAGRTIGPPTPPPPPPQKKI